MRTTTTKADAALLRPADLPPLLTACDLLETRHHLRVRPEAWKGLCQALVRAHAAWLAVRATDHAGRAREVLVWSDVPAGEHPWEHHSRRQVRDGLATWLAYRSASEWHASDEVVRRADELRDGVTAFDAGVGG